MVLADGDKMAHWEAALAAVDLKHMLDRLIPPGRDYGHERAWHDRNGHSHLQATLILQLRENVERTAE